MKLFTCTASAFSDEALCSMPGFSHRSQPEKIRVTWYPFEEWKVRVFFYASSRRKALRQLQDVLGVRDLDDGKTVALSTLPRIVAFNAGSL